MPEPREFDIEVVLDGEPLTVLSHGRLNGGPDAGLMVIHCTRAVAHERRCPTCEGSGLVWRGTNTKRRGRLNDDNEPCVAAFRCPTCPDDGSGNCKGTGRIGGDPDGC